MSLNHKRRIFRPGIGPVPLRMPSLPSPGVWLAATGATATLFAAAWLFVRSSDAPAHAPPGRLLAAAAGTLAVLDGDTMRVGDQVLRLDGIAAPPRGSACRSNGQQVDCGTASANALALLVRGRSVDCAITGHDDHGRPVGDCQAGGIGLSEALVRDGWALAQTAALRRSEAAARAAGRGLWAASDRL